MSVKLCVKFSMQSNNDKGGLPVTEQETLRETAKNKAKALKSKRKAAVSYISSLMAEIDGDNSNIKEAIKYRSTDLDWSEKTLKKICSIHNKQNFAAFKADIEMITESYEALYGSGTDMDDLPEGETSTSSPDMRSKRKIAIEYITSMMAEVDVKTEQLKDAIKLKAPSLDWEDKVLRKMASLRNKDKFYSYKAENESLTDEYELIFGKTKYE